MHFGSTLSVSSSSGTVYRKKKIEIANRKDNFQKTKIGEGSGRIPNFPAVR